MKLKGKMLNGLISSFLLLQAEQPQRSVQSYSRLSKNPNSNLNQTGYPFLITFPSKDLWCEQRP